MDEALKILLDEWDKMQPGRYRTLTESDEDAAFYVGFHHAIQILQVRKQTADVQSSTTKGNADD